MATDVVYARGANASGRIAVKIENTSVGGSGNASLQLYTDSGQIGVVLAQSSAGGSPGLMYVAGKATAGVQIAAESASGPIVLSTGGTASTNERVKILSSGLIAVSAGATPFTPTAKLHLGAGTTAASTAPLKFTSGNVMTAAEAGAMEFQTDDYFLTITSSASRRKVPLWLTDTGSTGSGRLIYANANGFLTNSSDFSVNSTTMTVTSLVVSTLTSGRVTFAGSSGLLTDSASFLWDTSNSRLNVGTGASTSTLDIYLQKTSNGQVSIQTENLSNGTAAISQNIVKNDAGNALLFRKFSSGYTTAGLRVANAGELSNSGAGPLLIENTHTADIIVVIGGSGTANEIARFTSTSFAIFESINITTGTSTGTKIGTATTQKLGFWNATPIVQPTTAIAAATFVANTSLIANDTATWDGYTMGQVVKALRNMGKLA